MALTDNLVSYWKLNESSGNASDSVGGNTLTNNNTCTYAPAKIANGVFTASASSQYLSITDASQTGLNPSGDFTIACWVYFSTLPGSGVYYGITGKGGMNTAISDTATEYGLRYDNDGSRRFAFYIRGTGVFKETVETVTLSTGTWYQMVGVFTGGTKIELYLNGSSVASLSSGIPSTVVNTAQPFVIGNMYSGTPGNYLNGAVDEVGFWSRALTSTDVSDLYNSGAGLTYPFTVSTPNSNFLIHMMQ